MQWGYLFIRLGVGMSLFGHGLVRMPKLVDFSEWMLHKFENAMLPLFLVKVFSYALPVAEFSIGLLLLLGLFTKQAAISGAILFLILIFGSCMIEEWAAIPSQLIHILFLSILLYTISNNHYSIDKKINNKI